MAGIQHKTQQTNIILSYVKWMPKATQSKELVVILYMHAYKVRRGNFEGGVIKFKSKSYDYYILL